MIDDEVQKFREIIEKVSKDSWTKPTVYEKDSIIYIKWWYGKRMMTVFIENNEYDVVTYDEKMRISVSGYFRNIESFKVFWEKFIEEK